MSESKYSKSDTIDLRRKYLGPSCKLFYKDEPLKLVRAEGCFMFDENGERYLDCANNVAHVGHCHPRVVEAAYKQMAQLNTNNRYLHDNLVEYARRLVDLFPANLSVIYFVNSGSEANDLALRLSWYYTKRRDVIVLDHAYHGHVSSVVDISPYKFNDRGGDGKKDWVHIANTPDRYRGKYTDKTYSEEALCDKYVDDIRVACEEARKNGGVSAFIAESMQSCGGQVIFPEGYLRKVYKLVRDEGGVCIADEVQVGFGRMGTKWWSFQLQGDDIVPDIVTVGKPMGNGHPLSAVITTRKIADNFGASGLEYFNTFGGNPVSCAIGNAVLDVIEDESLIAHAKEVGDYLKIKFKQLQEKHQIIGDVRGQGMFLGIDLVKDRTTREPATAEAAFANKRLKEEKVLFCTDGPYRNVLKFKSPLVFGKPEADVLCEKLSLIFKEMEQAELLVNGVIGLQPKDSLLDQSANVLEVEVEAKA